MKIVALYIRSLGWLHTVYQWSPSRRVAPAADRMRAAAELQRFHLAFHLAYHRFARTYPQWVHRGFDADFLRQALAAQRVCFGQSSADLCPLPTATQLSAAWDRRFGILVSDTIRVQQMAELAQAANSFLCSFQVECEHLAAAAAILPSGALASSPTEPSVPHP